MTQNTTTPAIEVDGLSFNYGDLKAVDGISFDVQPRSEERRVG